MCRNESVENRSGKPLGRAGVLVVSVIAGLGCATIALGQPAAATPQPADAVAQSPAQRIAELEKQVQMLQQQGQALQREIQSLRQSVESHEVTAAQPVASPTAPPAAAPAPRSKLLVVEANIAITGAAASAADAGGGSEYGLYNNYSLLGVHGQYETDNGWVFGYNYTARIGPLYKEDGARSNDERTFLGYLSLASERFGELAVGRQQSLYGAMVDWDVMQANWFFQPGTSPWHVDAAVTYRTPMFAGTQVGLQAFDVAKASGSHSGAHYAIAVQHHFGDDAGQLSAGYMRFARYADGVNRGSWSPSIDNFGAPVNTFAGIVLDSMYGVGGHAAFGDFSFYGAVNIRKPFKGLAQNQKQIRSYLATATYDLSPQWKALLAADYTRQGEDGPYAGLSGLVPTAGVYYAPTSNLLFSVEYQHYSGSANRSCYDGTWCGTKANGQIAFSGTYSFTTDD